ncbi:MAG: hypothetical protein LBN95_11815 [Prevotellaceae bacterium]|jgi:hypothetical protein|nr:hypothetical protein [Prevotellaceae bacterium]
MKKNCLYVLLIIAFLLNVGTLFAQDKAYKMTTFAEYGYNSTWQNFGGLAFTAEIPIKQYFEIDCGVKLFTANVYAVSGTFRTILQAKKGKFYLEERIIYRAFARNHINELSAAFYGGYYHNYFDVGIGTFSQAISVMGYQNDNMQHRYLVVPFNLLYNIEVRLKKESSKWNVGLKISNGEIFELERFFSPIYTFKGHFSTSQHIDLQAEMAFKPAGTFHQASNFFEFSTRIGLCYKF